MRYVCMKNIKYVLPQKSDLKQIKVSEINFTLPDLKNNGIKSCFKRKMAYALD